MTDLRTPFEKDVHDLLRDIQATFNTPHYLKRDFTALLGRLRDARVSLDNKQYGCSSGDHAGPCRCKKA